MKHEALKNRLLSYLRRGIQHETKSIWYLSEIQAIHSQRILYGYVSPRIYSA